MTDSLDECDDRPQRHAGRRDLEAIDAVLDELGGDGDVRLTVDAQRAEIVRRVVVLALDDAMRPITWLDGSPWIVRDLAAGVHEPPTLGDIPVATRALAALAAMRADLEEHLAPESEEVPA